MRHKCPNCNASFIPITVVNMDIGWETQKISAERAMHLEDNNYFCWRCPECGHPIVSEILAKFIFPDTYAGLERALRREKGERCDT